MKLNKLNNLFNQARIIAENSPDKETKVGCLIINPNGYRTISSGYNGFISGGPDSSLPKTRPDKYNYILHAELNALLQLSKYDGGAENCIAICTLSPCINCCRALWQAGIKTIVFEDKYTDFDKQLNMLDLNFILTKQDKYTIIKLEARNEREKFS